MFFGGIPTGSDVKRLLESFPDIKPGETVFYSQVASVIGAEHGSSRFQSVTNAWRRTLMRTQNFVLEAVPGQGFRRRTEVERSKANRAGWRQDQSRAARRVRDLARTDTSGFDEREQKAHVEHTSTTVRELAPPAPLKMLPKREAS